LAKKRNKGQKRKGIYQRRFDDSDLVWLAEKFNEETKLNPDLSIEEFAIRYGIQAKLISRYIVKPHGLGRDTVTVWHGTTADRVKAIMEEGFKARGKAGKKIWFTMKPTEAHSIAKWRAQQRGEEAVVLCCEINLDKYSEFDRPQSNHYAFRHPRIYKEVIRSVSGVKKDKIRRSKEKKEKKRKRESVDVTITKISGKLGILHWINSYLNLKGEDAVSEEHPAVETVHKWVEAQYSEGRDEPIFDEEMLLQVMKYFGGEAEEKI